VVGAGLAGLGAALALQDRGVPVTVLEARQRVGGRVFTRHLSNGEPAELGAEWIMPGDDRVLDLAERFGIEAVEAGIDYRRREARGRLAASPEEQDVFLAAASEARTRLSEADATSLTLGRFLASLEGSEAAGTSVRMRLQGTAGTDLERVALRTADREHAFAAEPARYFRLGPGNQALPEAMAAALDDVRMRHSVVEVRHDRTGVEIRTEGDALRAGAAVVAVPVRVAARLRYEPPLPDDLAIALRQLPMGVASKLAVSIEGEPALRAIQSTDLPYWCWVANGTGGIARRALASFAGSDLAQEGLRTADGDPTVWLQGLAKLNPDLRLGSDPLSKAWAGDAFTLGSYSSWDNRSWDRLDQFQRRVGRVCFAGEHTAGPDHYATMNGALLSGERAARQVLEILG